MTNANIFTGNYSQMAFLMLAGSESKDSRTYVTDLHRSVQAWHKLSKNLCQLSAVARPTYKEPSPLKMAP